MAGGRQEVISIQCNALFVKDEEEQLVSIRRVCALDQVCKQTAEIGRAACPLIDEDGSIPITEIVDSRTGNVLYECQSKVTAYPKPRSAGVNNHAS